MPPAKRTTHDDPTALKEKLHAQQAPGGRGRRTGGAAVTNGSHLKEVMNTSTDNATTSNGQSEQNTSGVSDLSAEAHKGTPQRLLTPNVSIDIVERAGPLPPPGLSTNVPA
jgi:hypothetical protein